MERPMIHALGCHDSVVYLDLLISLHLSLMLHYAQYRNLQNRMTNWRYEAEDSWIFSCTILHCLTLVSKGNCGEKCHWHVLFGRKIIWVSVTVFQKTDDQRLSRVGCLYTISGIIRYFASKRALIYANIELIRAIIALIYAIVALIYAIVH